MKIKICGCNASVVYLFLKQANDNFYSIRRGEKLDTFDIITKPDAVGLCETRVVLTYINTHDYIARKTSYITLEYSHFDRVAIDGITTKKEV
nr:MAG TPA: hypothetical protein [Caudoviricetes sp.]